MVTIEQVDALADREVADLAEILIGVVAEGYSIGYMTPPTVEDATAYWKGIIGPNIRLLLAKSGDRVVGTAQLELATRENGLHRAEVNKVLVHPDHHGQGIGKRLMVEIEALARREGRTLLYLDTNENDPANEFYGRTGWTKAGTIPNWAGSPRDGQVHGTTFYYELLD